MTDTKTILTEKEISKVAKLAHLPLTEKETNQYTSELSSVLKYFSHIEKIDTQKYKETHQVTNTHNVFRDDEIDESRILTQAQALQNATKVHQGFIVVPALLKNR